MADVVCFLLERTDLARRSFRRFVFSQEAKCASPYGYHNASVPIAECEPFVSEFEGDDRVETSKDDPRWPKACPCGYEFQPEDQWQENLDRLYRAPDGKLAVPTGHAPGAMWNASWYAERSGTGWQGPDGQSLFVILPDGVAWHIDGPAKGGGRWTREGVAPKITARPSILTSGYHGFLTDGVLRSC